MRDATCKALGKGLAHRLGKVGVRADPQPSPHSVLNCPLPRPELIHHGFLSWTRDVKKLA